MLVASLLTRVSAQRKIFHEDNVKADPAWMSNEFLLENYLEQYENAAVSPDWSPCDFFLLAKVKKQFCGIRLNDDNEMFTAFEQAFDTLTKEDFPRLVYSNALMFNDTTSTKLSPLNTYRKGLLGKNLFSGPGLYEWCIDLYLPYECMYQENVSL